MGLLKGFKSEHEEGGDLQIERGNLPNPGQAEQQFSEESYISQVLKGQQNPRSPKVYFKASLPMAAN